MRSELIRSVLAACVGFTLATEAAKAAVVESQDAVVSPTIEIPSLGGPHDGVIRTAGWPFFFGNGSKPLYDSLPNEVKPHPAVARIIVPEDGATAFGSGTLVGVREDRALVVTNWHVVRDGTGLVEVVFPDGFRSHARPLRVDSDWDLAALVIWRPNAEPVTIATLPPRPGDILTIHGYGRGKYRIATGRCTTFYAPQPNFPHEVLELDVEARQGDSGGPIFNQSGELAGVLFGSGQGCTMGSFAPRVRNFLASVAPNIDQDNSRSGVAAADRQPPNMALPIGDKRDGFIANYPSSPWSPPKGGAAKQADANGTRMASTMAPKEGGRNQSFSWGDLNNTGWYEPLKTAFAVVGVAVITLRVVKLVR